MVISWRTSYNRRGNCGSWQERTGTKTYGYLPGNEHNRPVGLAHSFSFIFRAES